MIKKNSYQKADIANNISKKIGLSVLLSKKIIDQLLQILTLQIKNSELNLKNLGTFKIINKKERIGRNPKTKKEYCLLYTSPSPRDKRQSRMPSSA